MPATPSRDREPDESRRAGRSAPTDGASARWRRSPESTEEAEPEMDWYILKVQSNRRIRSATGCGGGWPSRDWIEFFGEILVPTEDVAEFKNGKRRVVKRKLYPGYIVVHMVINDETWFLVRETPGIGDFTGAAGKPTPMLPHEVERIVKADPTGRRRWRTDQDRDSLQDR